MELKCSVEELKLLFKNFDLKEQCKKIRIDGEEVGKLIAPSIKNVFNKTKA